MKQIRYLVCCVFLLVGMVSFSACDDDEKIKFSDLPSESQSFIDIYFSGVAVNKVEKDDGIARYKVYLNNGFTLKFYKDGGWQEVDGGSQAIFDGILHALLPGSILAYVNQEFPAAAIVEISQHTYGYEVDLNTIPEVDLKFDRDGNLLVVVN